VELYLPSPNTPPWLGVQLKIKHRDYGVDDRWFESDYGLDDRWFEFCKGLGIFLFTTAFRPAWGPPNLLSNEYQRLLPLG
jgi:hypothetical protein